VYGDYESKVVVEGTDKKQGKKQKVLEVWLDKVVINKDVVKALD